jgi:chromate transporter
LKLGFISFGGPAGQIALMHDEVVERRRWISERRFLHALNYCMVLPGPEAQQLATYLGWLMHGTWGGIAAGALFVLPSLLILMLLSWIYVSWGDVPAVAAILWGVKPAVVAIVAFAGWRIGARVLRNGLLWAVAVAAFIGIAVIEAPFPAIIAAAAAIGWAAGHWRPQLLAVSASHGTSGRSDLGPAAIDADTPMLPHHRFSARRALGYLAAGAGLGLATMAALVATAGWSGTLAQMGWFFTKAALLTFGGAYAVLPYVYQGAVDHFGWLSAAQMIDGLALGETTPGPLIMVVAFVGYLGAWNQAVLGAEWQTLGALLGAAVATFFTFLPSFLFILIGAPFIETTHENLRLTAPLAAITAAVVGVIASLAVFFARHVFWPQGWEGAMDWAACAIAAGALLALIRFRIGVIPVIGACAALGLLIRLAQ